MVRCLTVLSQMIPQLSEWPCLHTSVFASAAGRASSDHVPWPLLAGRTMWPVSHPGSQAEGVLYRSECERVPPLPWALSVLSVRADTGATVSPVWLRLCWAASRNVFMPWHLSSSRGLPEVGTRAAGAPPPLGPRINSIYSHLLFPPHQDITLNPIHRRLPRDLKTSASGHTADTGSALF